MDNNVNGYYRGISALDAVDRPQYIGYYTDDEVESMWATSRDDEPFGELILGDE